MTTTSVAQAPQSSTRAQNAYAVRNAEITAKLDRLGDLLAEHERQAANHPTHWINVGDLEHVAELLGEVIEFLGGES